MKNIEWRPSTEQNEITLLVDGKRRAALVPWAECGTQQTSGWSAVLVEADGIEREVMGADVFWTPIDDMKRDVLVRLGLIHVDAAAPNLADDTASRIDGALTEVGTEVCSATASWPPFNSAHEGFAVLREEVDELWDHVKTNQKRRDLPAMRAEAIQVAAMAVRFALEVCDEERGRK